MAVSDSTVIIGAGINGLATAFYLAQGQKCGNNIFVVEISSDVVSAASGKANGVLSDYGRTAPVADLAHLSWKLHQQLATTHNGISKWGYVKAVRHELCIRNDRPQLQAQYSLPHWLRGRDQYFQSIKGNPYNCARLYV
jgi:glycine/D-amino acid oxidase-like deaminating enzyme